MLAGRLPIRPKTADFGDVTGSKPYNGLETSWGYPRAGPVAGASVTGRWCGFDTTTRPVGWTGECINGDRSERLAERICSR